MPRFILLMSTGLLACGGPKPAPPATADAAAPAPAAEPTYGEGPEFRSIVPEPAPEGAIVSGELMTGLLVLGTDHTPVGTPVSVRWHLPGRNGCYQQSEVTTVVDGQDITHAYTTDYQGAWCTLSFVPGGFQTSVTLDVVGSFTGHIVVDGVEQATYRLLTTPE